MQSTESFVRYREKPTRMQSGEGNLLEIIDLAQSLRQEQLFITNEQNTFAKLNETLARNSANASQLAWICAQQRQNLNTLIISRPDTGPSVCCHRAHLLENTKFIDAHKVKALKYQHVLAYIELFNFLYRSPYLLAQSLEIGDRLGQMSVDQMNSVVHTIATGLYGNAILSKDVDMVLRLLRELIEIQVVVSDNPRRMLRGGSCAFSRLYHRLHESLFSAKLFLTAALHEPIMKVLFGDDQSLDVDPNKAIANFTARERLRRFGAEGTDEYEENVQKFRQTTVKQLHSIAKLFIKSLADHWSLFPSTLRWVIQTMYHLLRRAHVNDKDVNDILTDMVFTSFICPAVVSPDLFGISDAPISETARFNLIQIGQIIQMLAIVKHEEIDPRFIELLEMFDRNLVTELMDQLLETEYDVSVSMMAIPHQNDFGRSQVLVTQSELNVFVDFLRSVLDNDGLVISGEDRRKLGKILDQLPDKLETTLINGDGSQSVGGGSPESRPKSSFISLGKHTKNRLAKSISLNQPNESDDLTPTITSTTTINGQSTNNNYLSPDDHVQVLMIPIAINEESKFQLLTEQEVLNMNNISNDIDSVKLPDKCDGKEPDETEFDTRKHTRFSLSNDDQSDNLEAVSEAPSNHSVTSSLEEMEQENDQNLNDNLSDMVSANVSGRGTPNISGRDTPSSQVTEGDQPPIPAQQMVKILNKARSDIDDKFCKFEIKKLVEGDETISIISDTWSTDVLASDSETIESSDHERNFSTPLIPSAVVLPGDNNFMPLQSGGMRANFLDASETRSESAWSTDVLASDSEKTNDVDTDDVQSVTAKSDGGDVPSIPDLVPTSSTMMRPPESPFFAPRAPNVMFRIPPDSPSFGSSQRQNADSQYFPTASDETVGRIQPDLTAAVTSIRIDDYPRFASPVSSFLRTAQTIRYSDSGLVFRSIYQQQPYRSNSQFDGTDGYLSAGNVTRMRRQNSAESSISNQSSNCGDDGTAISRRSIRNDENIVKTSTDIINPFANDDLDQPELFPRTIVKEDEFGNDAVEHRRTSSVQRHASFDGRRNGMSAFSNSSLEQFNKRLVTCSYENHEIIQKMNDKSTSDETGKEPDDFLLMDKMDSLNIDNESVENQQSAESGQSKPPRSTGAIPKSISFDSSADKTNHRHSSRRQAASALFASTEQRTNGFFNKIKQGFKNRRSNKFRGGGTAGVGMEDYLGDLQQRPASMVIMNGRDFEGNPIDPQYRPTDTRPIDTSDDILAKYRRKISSSSEATTSDSTGSNQINVPADQRIPDDVIVDEAHYYFQNAKRKLRIVLSLTDLHTADFRHTNANKTPPLLTYLQIQLAQALNLQNLQQIAFVSEAIRSLYTLDSNQQNKLLVELQQDLINRQSYLQYLLRYRQNLLSALENIDRFEERIRNDREMCNRHLIMVCVRMFLEKREQLIERFHDDFTAVTVVDEKIDFLNEFMVQLMDELKVDGILHGMTDWQLREARISIERILMQRLYRQFMFPNEDADVSRDEVLRQHIRKLNEIITPAHDAIRIPQEYLIEAPWPFAQQQISYISAYKTPREKVLCVVRCIISIMNLLQMASNRVPAADDLVPVLIYVIIKANPPYLLSTIQYVNAFIGDELEGKDHYWWTQFCSAVTFIKTMDYSN